jgi:O-methyltransferase involved in polyketide biosynthesis
MGDFLPVRTCFFDRVVDEAATEQVVILAAGLDGRAWRLHRPAATVVHEIDVPEVLAFRDAVATDLTPTVAYDAAHHDAGGYDAARSDDAGTARRARTPVTAPRTAMTPSPP